MSKLFSSSYGLFKPGGGGRRLPKTVTKYDKAEKGGGGGVIQYNDVISPIFLLMSHVLPLLPPPVIIIRYIEPRTHFRRWCIKKFFDNFLILCFGDMWWKN